MKSLKKILWAAFCLIGTLNAALAFAEEAGMAGHEQITFLHDWLPRLVNFAIFLVALIYIGRKFPFIQDFFKNRAAEIAKAIQESREAHERAVADLAEMEQRVKTLEKETNSMISEARARGEKDKQALIDEGKRLVLDVQNQVRQGIDMEVRKAKSALAIEASLLSLSLAESRIKEKISTKDHERIVQEYISEVGGKE